MTRDVDFAISVESDEEAETTLYKLQQLGYTVQTVVEQSSVGRLATARLTRGEGGVLVDLLFSSSGIEREVVEAGERIELLLDMTAKVACVGHLIALKLLSESPKRPQDAIDLVALAQEASDTDLAVTREAIVVITKRGYNRGRDLSAALEALISRLTG